MSVLSKLYNMGWYGRCDTWCEEYDLRPSVGDNSDIEAVYRVSGDGYGSYETYDSVMYGTGMNAFESLTCGNAYIIRLKKQAVENGRTVEIPNFTASFAGDVGEACISTDTPFSITPGPTPSFTPTPTPTISPTSTPGPTPTPTPTKLVPLKSTLHATSENPINFIQALAQDQHNIITLEAVDKEYVDDSDVVLSPTTMSTMSQPFTSIWNDDRLWNWVDPGYKAFYPRMYDGDPESYDRNSHSWLYTHSHVTKSSNSFGAAVRRKVGAPISYEFVSDNQVTQPLWYFPADQQPYMRGLSTGAIRRSTVGIANNEWNDRPTSGEMEVRQLQFKIDPFHPERGVYVGGGSPPHRIVDTSAGGTTTMVLPDQGNPSQNADTFYKYPSNATEYQVGERIELYNPAGISTHHNQFDKVPGYEGGHNYSLRGVELPPLVANIDFYKNKYVVAEVTNDPAGQPLSDGPVFREWKNNSTVLSSGTTDFSYDRTAGGPNRDNALSGHMIPLSAWMRLEMMPITSIDVDRPGDYDLILRSTTLEPIPTPTPTPTPTLTPTPTPTPTLSGVASVNTSAPSAVQEIQATDMSIATVNPDRSIEHAKRTYGSPGWRSQKLQDHNQFNQWVTRFKIGGADKYGYKLHVDELKDIHVAGTFDTHLVVNYDLDVNETYSVMYDELGTPHDAAFDITTPTYSQAFISKHNSKTGKMTSCLTTRGHGRSQGHDVVTDSVGNMYLVGSLAGDVDFVNDHGVLREVTMGVNTRSLSCSYGFVARVGWGHQDVANARNKDHYTQKPLDYTWDWVQYVDTRVITDQPETREIRTAVIDPQDQLYVAGYFDSPTEIGTSGAKDYQDSSKFAFEDGYRWENTNQPTVFVAKMDVTRFGQVEWSTTQVISGVEPASIKLITDDDMLLLTTNTNTLTSGNGVSGGTTIQSIDMSTGQSTNTTTIYGGDIQVTDVELVDDGRIALSINFKNQLEVNGVLLHNTSGVYQLGAYVLLDQTLQNTLAYGLITSTSNDVTCDSITVNYVERELLVYGTSKSQVSVKLDSGEFSDVSTTQTDKYLTYVTAYDL